MQHQPGPREAADVIAGLATVLCRMAHAHGLEELAFLLAMTAEEARRTASAGTRLPRASERCSDRSVADAEPTG